MEKKSKKKEKIFGRTALRMGVVDKKQLREARKIQRSLKAMGLLPKGLSDILLEKGYLDEKTIEEVWESARRRSLDKIQIEGYRLLTVLGKGSVGTVYKGLQLNLDREVAIKILHPSLQDNEVFLERFLREAKATANLQSPHIIRGFDVVETSSGYYGLVMELVDGTPLHKILSERKKIPEREAGGIIFPLVEALRALSSKGMVHRDIKPSNILITPDGRPKLCDLGLAKPFTSDPSITSSGIAVGSPHYISPEQARDDAIDIRSDIYSLGVVFFEMISGQKPFGESRDLLQIIARAVTEDIPPVSQLESHLSEEVTHIVTKMTRRKLKDRYEGGDALLEDMEHYLQGEPLPSLQPGDSTRMINVSLGRKGRGKKKISSKKPLKTSSENPEDDTSALLIKKRKSPSRSRNSLDPVNVIVILVVVLCLGMVLLWLFLQGTKTPLSQKKYPPRHRPSPRVRPPLKKPPKKAEGPKPGKKPLLPEKIDREKIRQLELRYARARAEREKAEKARAEKEKADREKKKLHSQKGMKKYVEVLAYLELLKSLLKDLGQFHFAKVQQRLKGEKGGWARELAGEVAKIQQLVQYARRELSAKIGQPNYALVLKSGKLLLGRIIEIDRSKIRFLANGTLKIVDFSALKAKQLLHLAKVYLDNHREKFDLTEGKGLFYLLVMGQYVSAQDPLCLTYGDNFFETNHRRAIQFRWFRFRFFYRQGLEAFSRKQWFKALGGWANILADPARDPFDKAKRDQLISLAEQAFLQSRLDQAFRGKGTFRRGIFCLEYDFSSANQLKDWTYQNLIAGEKRPGQWKRKGGKLIGTGGADLVFRAPLQRGVVVVVTLSPLSEYASMAISLGTRYKNQRKYGLVAGIHIPLGDEKIFPHTKNFRQRGLVYTGIFQFQSSRKIRSLDLNPLLPGETRGKMEIKVKGGRERMVLFLNGKALADARGTYKGDRLAIKVWNGVSIEKIKIYGLPKSFWLRKRLGQLKKKGNNSK